MFSVRSRSLAMVRGLAVFLLFCLSAQPVFAFNINWHERVQKFSRYVDQHSVAQGRRVQVLETQSKGFTRRVHGYLRALEAQARPFQTQPVPSASRD